MGCSSGDFPFTNLGLKVGANMNSVNSWSSIFGGL